MKHIIKFEVSIWVDADDCTTAEHAAMDFLGNITGENGIEFSYTMSPTSGMCSHTEEDGGAKLESCPKCGDNITRGEAFTDEGTGEESGRTFYYCSERCRETH